MKATDLIRVVSTLSRLNPEMEVGVALPDGTTARINCLVPSCDDTQIVIELLDEEPPSKPILPNIAF